MWEYRAKVRRVVDGDTIDLVVDCGFNIAHYLRARLARVDAWEKRGVEREKGKLATAFVESELAGLDWITVRTKKRGKYGRYITEIEYNGKNLSDELVKHGHAHYETY